jgi:hypothetical protein
LKGRKYLIASGQLRAPIIIPLNAKATKELEGNGAALFGFDAAKKYLTEFYRETLASIEGMTEEDFNMQLKSNEDISKLGDE